MRGMMSDLKMEMVPMLVMVKMVLPMPRRSWW
jgi:hypothetical protein